MAGVVPLSGKTVRKQWFSHDGPRGSLRGLRSQLAEAGCAESQVVLGKELLEDTNERDVDKEENAKLGVYWLTRASEQGNMEATEILKKCLETGHGITEHNYYDAKSCLEMPQDEKSARRAARELFSSLSNGEDFVTMDQLRRQLRTIRDGSRRDSDDDSLHSSEGNSECSGADRGSYRSLEYPESFDHQGEKITEAALVSAATSYARGLLPTVSRALCMVNQRRLELENFPLLQRPFVHPLESLKWMWEWIVERIGRRGGTYTRSFLTSNIQTLILLIVYSLFGTESLVLFVPMVIYYLSFIIMVVATFQMLQCKREFHDFRNWSGLFISYSGGNLNADEAEYQFCRNNLKPYGHFFLALLVNLMIYPVIAHQWTPQSEFTVIAVVFTLATLYNFGWKDSSKLPDFLALISFAVHVLAKYPYETDIVVAQTWRFLDIRVPTFASYVVGNGIEFCLNFRAVFYLLIPGVFAKMAGRDGWKGTYKTLIPHCVTLSWWQIAILSSQGATWYGLIRGALALVGMVLFLPIAGLASILLPIIAAARYLSDSDVAMKIGITVVMGGLPFIASWYLRRVRGSRFNWIITYVQILVGALAGIFLCWPVILDYKNGDDGIVRIPGVSSLTWEQFQNHCHQPAWEELSSKAQVQIQCAHLEGIPVFWEGYVTNVRVKRIDNSIAGILKRLPESIESSLGCVFGEPVDQTVCQALDSTRKTTCEMIMKMQRGKCQVVNWNRYEFEIYVNMKNGLWGSNTEIVLVGDHSFMNFSLSIYAGDKIQFSGVLSNEGGEGESLLGGTRPMVHLDEISCSVCHNIHLKPSKRHRESIISVAVVTKTLVLGVKTVLNFLLNPLVVFK
ncbi:wolframin [Fopius arisanus]|uniref:Wfs1_0 protein n=2 Tax=Braconidae TaxID=7402 RepID=A0A0C9QKN0_9HYME|nr:PREDICTED: wolframin [Fopius arisanus]